MITSILMQSDAGTPVVLCKANAHTKEKQAAACYAAQRAFMRSLYGYQPGKGLINGYVNNVMVDGAIVVIELGFVQYDYRIGVFELPIHIFKFQGQRVTSSMDVVDWIGRPVALQVVNRYMFEGIFLSNIAAVHIDDEVAEIELSCEMSGKTEV